MKLWIYFKPWIAVALLGVAAAVFWGATLAAGGLLALLALAGALFYSALTLVAGWALWRIHRLERWIDWETPGRLLILSPHEDDCVITAGAIGAANRRLGGVTRIVYLAPDEAPGMPERRAREARTAWQEAGLDPGALEHLDLLPRLYQSDPQKLRAAARTLRALIDDFKPTAIVTPMFEGGHVQHDMTAAVLGTIVTPHDRFEVFEAPEYGPYTSLNNTPHRVIALCTRWLLGVVAYCAPPDGIDGRPILKVRLDPRDLACKRRMLGAFVSQNAPSLMATRSYPDRLVRWDASRQRRFPYDFRRSYLRLTVALRRVLPGKIVGGLLPVQHGAIGREGSITDWDKEWGRDA